MSLTKQLRAQRLCGALRLPLVSIVDTGGAFLPLQAEVFNRGGHVFHNQAVLQAEGMPHVRFVCAPWLLISSLQISVVAGGCVAGGAYGPTMTDNAIMVDKFGTLFLGGPALVRAATGEVISAEVLGGANTHCRCVCELSMTLSRSNVLHSEYRGLRIILHKRNSTLTNTYAIF